MDTVKTRKLCFENMGILHISACCTNKQPPGYLSLSRSLKPYKNQYLILSSSNSLDRNNNDYPQEPPPIHATIAHKEGILERTH